MCEVFVSERLQREKWWARTDLNCRPADYESNRHAVLMIPT